MLIPPLILLVEMRSPSQHEIIKTDLVLIWYGCPEFQATTQVKRAQLTQ